MKTNGISMRAWLRRYWFSMFAVLIVTYFIMQSFIMTMLTQRREENVRTEIASAGIGVEQAISVVDSFVNEALYTGTPRTTSELYNVLLYESDPILRTEAVTTVLQSMRGIVSWSDMIDFALLYTNGSSGEHWLEIGSLENFAVRQEIKKLIRPESPGASESDTSRYAVYRTSKGSCLLRVVDVQKCRLVVGIAEAELLRMLHPIKDGGNTVVFTAEPDGRLLFSSEELAAELPFAQDGKYVHLNGKTYLQAGKISEATGLYFGKLTDKGSIMNDLWIFRILFMVPLTIMLLLVPISFGIMVRKIERPISEISGTMDMVAAGDLDLSVNDSSKITEIGLLSRAFNHMIVRTKALKIEKYEEQIKAQKATMQYLQMQIKPHFFVNMLNIIYALAESRDYVRIQKVSQAVVAYSRYMFRDASELVELRRELEHVSNYMDIQQIRYNSRALCRLNIAEHTTGAMVPPFVIQSFVENSVKYAFTRNRVCEIEVSVDTDAEREFLSIEIRDNGDGYSPELLEKGWDEKGGEGHIGLSNIHQRLELIYNDKATISIANDNGAVTRISVPFISSDVDSLDFDD